MADDAAWPSPRDGVVTLRVLEMRDADAWKAGEDEEQRRWFEMPGPAPMENVVAAITRWRASWRDNNGGERHWGVWHQHELTGGVAVRVREDGRANVSYIVFPPWRRRGFAVRAVRLATDWAFDHLDAAAAVAVINPGNEASTRTAIAAGFVYDGEADAWEYGETGPMKRYLLTR